MSIVLKIDVDGGQFCSKKCMFLHNSYCLLFQTHLDTYKDEGEHQWCCDSCSHISMFREDDV